MNRPTPTTTPTGADLSGAHLLVGKEAEDGHG
jgi:hypothetical protein